MLSYLHIVLSGDTFGAKKSFGKIPSFQPPPSTLSEPMLEEEEEEEDGEREEAEVNIGSLAPVFEDRVAERRADRNNAPKTSSNQKWASKSMYLLFIALSLSLYIYIYMLYIASTLFSLCYQCLCTSNLSSSLFPHALFLAHSLPCSPSPPLLA